MDQFQKNMDQLQKNVEEARKNLRDVDLLIRMFKINPRGRNNLELMAGKDIKELLMTKPAPPKTEY